MEDKEPTSNIMSCFDGGAAGAAAAFVMKTYRMVDDPATDALVVWGSANNSFVVVDPFGFAKSLLPAHFKHGNFSSFVRQLNTYGFRKVDPDRWEFAHESFLRGKTYLLRRIFRRNSGAHSHGTGNHHSRASGEGDGGGDDMDDGIVAEVARLQQEQREVDEEIRSMWRRVEETENQARQMLAFLFKAVQEPDLLPHLREQSAFAVQQEARLWLHPSEGKLRETDVDTDAPVLPASDPVGCPWQFLQDFVGGGGLGMDEAAVASAYHFFLPTK